MRCVIEVSLITLVFSMISIGLSASAISQDGAGQDNVIKKSVDLVSVYFTVRDNNKQLASQLDQGEFRVLEDGKEKDGRVLSTMTYTLSDGGKTQTIKGTETKPDGTTSDFDVVWTKVSGGSGWGGTWEEKDVKFTSPDEWDIEPYENDGLSFKTPAYQETLSMKFDGKDYEDQGPNGPRFHVLG